MYGACLAQLCEAEYLEGLDLIIAKILEDDIDEEKIGQVLLKAEELAMKWEYDLRCTSVARCKVTYLGLELQLPVHNAASVARCKVMTAVKVAGVQSGCIIRLWFEAEILPLEPMMEPQSVDEALTKPINTMRRMINEQAATSVVSSGELSVKMMEAQLAGLEQVDGSAMIEICLAKALASGPGEKKLDEEMNRCLPTATLWMTLAESVAALERLQGSALHKFTPLIAQSKLGEVLSSVKSLCRGVSPCFTAWGGNSGLKIFKDEILPLFLVHDLDEEGFDGRHVRGLGAAMALLQRARKAYEEDALDLSHIGPLTTYDWILSQEANDEVQVWMRSIWSSAGVQGASAVQRITQQRSSSSSDMLVGPARKKLKTTAAADAAENVANLFT